MLTFLANWQVVRVIGKVWVDYLFVALMSENDRLIKSYYPWRSAYPVFVSFGNLKAIAMMWYFYKNNI